MVRGERNKKGEEKRVIKGHQKEGKEKCREEKRNIKGDKGGKCDKKEPKMRREQNVENRKKIRKEEGGNGDKKGNQRRKREIWGGEREKRETKEKRR